MILFLKKSNAYPVYTQGIQSSPAYITLAEIESICSKYVFDQNRKDDDVSGLLRMDATCLIIADTKNNQRTSSSVLFT